MEWTDKLLYTSEFELEGTVDYLLDSVAEDFFEGWADYWTDGKHQEIRKQIMTLLGEWHSYCIQQAS